MTVGRMIAESFLSYVGGSKACGTDEKTAATSIRCCQTAASSHFHPPVHAQAQKASITPLSGEHRLGFLGALSASALSLPWLLSRPRTRIGPRREKAIVRERLASRYQKAPRAVWHDGIALWEKGRDQRGRCSIASGRMTLVGERRRNRRASQMV